MRMRQSKGSERAKERKNSDDSPNIKCKCSKTLVLYNIYQKNEIKEMNKKWLENHIHEICVK